MTLARGSYENLANRRPRPSRAGLGRMPQRPFDRLLERDNFKKERKSTDCKRIEDLEEALNAGAGRPGTASAGEMRPEPAIEGSRPGPAQRPAPLRLSLRRTNLLRARTPFRVASISPLARNSAGRGSRAHINSRRQCADGPLLPGGSVLAVEPGRRSTAGWHLALSDNSSVAQITLHPALTGGIGRAVGLATRDCWWWSNPATLAAISSMRPAISAWPCSIRP